MQDIRKLRVWQEARVLGQSVFAITQPISDRDFPGLVSQFRRAATSIGANIAEGAAHVSPREFARYLQQALASAAEVEHHAAVAVDLGALSAWDSAAVTEDARRLQRMLVLLHRRVTAAQKSKPSTVHRKPKARPPTPGTKSINAVSSDRPP